jgi:hypothetical protein
MSVSILRAARSVLLAIGISAILICPEKTIAGGTQYLLDNVFSGQSMPPAQAGPWVSATFLDASPGTVLLTVTNVGLSSGEFISGLYFNLNPADKATDLSFGLVSSSGSFAAPTISLGADSFKADGDGKYDVLLDFGTANGTTFAADDSITYQITGIPNLVASDFNFLSAPAGGAGPYYAAAHYQGTPPNNGGSCWIQPSQGPISVLIPEASSGSLVGLAAVCFLLYRLNRRAAIARG